MENKERQILSEIKDIMASVRSQMEALEAKMDELQQLVDQDLMEMDPIDLDIDDIMEEPSAEPEPVAGPEPEQEEEPLEEVVVMESEEVVEDDLPIFDDLGDTEIPDDDLPFDDVTAIVAEPVSEPSVEPVSEAVVIEPKVAVIDSMTDRQAWRTDMPGTHVRDIRSAISLNDRILFINTLFAQDPMAFQETLTKINQMTSLDEVVSYVVSEHSEWNLESETVYRFMMAVRRKVEE